MSMSCTRCEGSGFLNLSQIEDSTLSRLDELGDVSVIQDWIKLHPDSDVSICDCCGDGERWYGEPGEHDYDQMGREGPYAYNGGLLECA